MKEVKEAITIHGVEEYLQGLKSYNFKEGDHVLVLRRATTGEAGWKNSWEDEMNQYVGRVGIINSEDEGWGIGVEFMDGDPHFLFPYFILEKTSMPGEAQVEPVLKPENPTIDELIDILHRRFPYGHPGFIPMTLDEMQLHSLKNHDYAHGGKPTGNFDRVARILSMYPGMDFSKSQNVAVTYLLKQLDAALWLENQGHTAIVQDAGERWRDVSVYAKIIILLLGEGKDEKN